MTVKSVLQKISFRPGDGVLVPSLLALFLLLVPGRLGLSFWLLLSLVLAVAWVRRRLGATGSWLLAPVLGVMLAMLALAPFAQMRALWAWVWVWGLVSWGLLWGGGGAQERGEKGAGNRGPVCSLLVLAALPLLALCLALRGGELGGDEPHYLMMAQSLWEDGDLDLENQVESGAYRRYTPQEQLRPHTVPVGAHARSFHLPGTALLPGLFWPLQNLLFGQGPVPAFWYRLLASIWGVLLALQLGRVLRRLFPKASAHQVLSVWGCMVLSLPFWAHGAHLYPEIPAAFLLLTAFDHLVRDGRPGSGFAFWAVLALWFHIKYAPLVFVLLLWGGWTLLRRSRGCSWRRRAASLLPPMGLALLPLLALLAYVWFLYGSWNPMDVYPHEAYLQTPHLLRLKVLLSYFLDQRDGLVWFFPLLLLLFGSRKMSHGPLLGVLLGGYVCAHAWTTVRGAHAPAGRPLMAVFWVLALLLASRWLGEGRRMAPWERVLAWSGIWWGGVVLLVPSWLVQPVFAGTTRGAAEHLRTLWAGAERLFPSFLTQEALLTPPNLFWTAVWLLPLFLAGGPWFSRRWPSRLLGVGVLLLPLLLWPGAAVPGTWHLLRGDRVGAWCSSRRVREQGDAWTLQLVAQNYVFLFPQAWQRGEGVLLRAQPLRGEGALRLPSGSRLPCGGEGVLLPWTQLPRWSTGGRCFRVLELAGEPDGPGYHLLALKVSSGGVPQGGEALR